MQAMKYHARHLRSQTAKTFWPEAGVPMQTPVKRPSPGAPSPWSSEKQRPPTTAKAKGVLWKYVHNCKRWKRHLPMAPGTKSWLAFRDGSVRCLACPSITFTSQQSLQFCNLLRHHTSIKHQQNVAVSLGGLGGPDGHARAPPHEQFRVVLTHLLDKGAHGKLKRMAPDALPSWDKRRRMEWCMAEAKRKGDREFLQQATVASLMADARGGSLLVRLAASDVQLNTRAMTLGLKHHYGSANEDAQKAIMTVIADMSTSHRGAPPRGWGLPQPLAEYDANLAAHVAEIVEVFTADAASDEQLAGRELQHPSSGSPSPLPNLKLVIRDKAHASRRLLSRPWVVDVFLKTTLDTLLFKKKSIVRLIQHSFLFKSWFLANQGGLGGQSGPPVKDLSYAGQRFDSRAKPLARFCMKFDALVKTAMQIAVRRHGKEEGTAATEFLTSLNMENMVQVGMLADAADEGLRFTRFCDSEGMDLGDLAGEVHSFISRITFLFVHGQAVQAGFTKCMLDAIKRVRIVFLGKRPLAIGDAGGASQAVVDACFARMACWVRLCISILRAEFPAFEVVQCFSMFNLGGARQDGHDDFDTKVARLARLCDVSPDSLRAEYMDLFPTAQRVCKDEQCETLSAWRQAVSITQRRRSMVRDHPVTALLPVLQRYAAYRGSTSGVEQSFSHLHFIQKAKRADSSEQAELDALTLRLDLAAAQHDAIIAAARSIWAAHYGACRAGRCRSFVSARPPQCESVMAVVAVNHTEADLLRARRTQVDAAAPKDLDLRTATAAAEKASQPAWTEAHQREVQVQATRALACRVDLAAQGLLLPEEHSAAIDQAAKLTQATRAKNWAGRQRKQRALQLLEQRPVPALANVRVHFAPGLGTGPAWSRALVQHRMRRCIDLAKADMFVVKDPTNVGLLTKLAVSLRGGRLATPEYVLSGGAGGACLAFLPATRTQKWIWASNRFRQQHPQTIRILQEVMAVHRAGMKWRWIESCSDYLLRCRGKSPAYQLNLIGLVTIVDKMRAKPVPWHALAHEKTHTHTHTHICLYASFL